MNDTAMAEGSPAVTATSQETGTRFTYLPIQEFHPVRENNQLKKQIKRLQEDIEILNDAVRELQENSEESNVKLNTAEAQIADLSNTPVALTEIPELQISARAQQESSSEFISWYAKMLPVARALSTLQLADQIVYVEGLVVNKCECRDCRAPWNDTADTVCFAGRKYERVTKILQEAKDGHIACSSLEDLLRVVGRKAYNVAFTID